MCRDPKKWTPPKKWNQPRNVMQTGRIRVEEELPTDAGSGYMINAIGSPIARRYVDVKIDGRSARLQQDTGADLTIVSIKFWKEVLGQPLLEKTKLKVAAVDGSPIRIIGKRVCSVIFIGKCAECVLYVGDIECDVYGLAWDKALGVEWIPYEKTRDVHKHAVERTRVEQKKKLAVEPTHVEHVKLAVEPTRVEQERLAVEPVVFLGDLPDSHGYWNECTSEMFQFEKAMTHGEIPKPKKELYADQYRKAELRHDHTGDDETPWTLVTSRKKKGRCVDVKVQHDLKRTGLKRQGLKNGHRVWPTGTRRVNSIVCSEMASHGRTIATKPPNDDRQARAKPKTESDTKKDVWRSASKKCERCWRAIPQPPSNLVQTMLCNDTNP